MFVVGLKRITTESPVVLSGRRESGLLNTQTSYHKEGSCLTTRTSFSWFSSKPHWTLNLSKIL